MSEKFILDKDMPEKDTSEKDASEKNISEKEYFIFEEGLDGNIVVIDHLTLNTDPSQKGYSHHDFFEIYHFLDGDVTFSVEGAMIDVEPGDIIILSQHLMHRVILHTTCRYGRRHILFSDDIFLMPQPSGLWLRNLLIKQGVMKISAQNVREAGLDNLLADVLHNITNHTPYDEFCALITLFQLLISAEKCYKLYGQPLLEIRNEKAHEILSYIDRHIADALDYKTLAKKFFMSEKSLYQIFKKETGLSPAHYINERRIIKAKLLLNNGYSAADVAHLTGYKDYSVFYRNFVKSTGVSPSDFSKSLGATDSDTYVIR